MTVSPRDKISRSMVCLLQDHPFFGNLALGMDIIVDPDLSPPTAGTNGQSIKYHPDFVNTLTNPQMLFLTAHEVMHPMLGHCTRRGNRHPKLWNIAGDYVINYLLVADNIGEMPPMAFYDKALYERHKGDTVGIYNELFDKATQDSLPDGEGSGFDNCTDAEGDNPAGAEAEFRVRVAQAAQTAKRAGKFSASLARFVDATLEPKVDWRNVLADFMVKSKVDARTFSRPNRRFVSQGLYMPTKTGEALDTVALFIDCSGSVGAHELAEFAAEARALQNSTMPKLVHVIYFDSSVCHHDTFEAEQEIVVASHGGGGTAYSPLFAYLEAQGIAPAVCVVLTDLECNDFGPAPDCPVLWVSTQAGQAPWGEVVLM